MLAPGDKRAPWNVGAGGPMSCLELGQAVGWWGPMGA